MLVGTAVALSGVARAEIEGEIHVGYASIYEFRGVNFGDHLAEGGADVSMEANGFGLSAGVWYGDVSDGGTNELDLYAAVSRDFALGKYTTTVELGYTHFTFPDAATGNPIKEPYLGISAEVIEGLSAGFTAYWATSNNFFADGSDLNGWWNDLSASYSREMAPGGSPEATVGITYSAGYNPADNDGLGFDGFDHVYATLGVPVMLTETASLNPFVKGVLNVSGDDRDFLIGGISLNVTW